MLIKKPADIWPSEITPQSVWEDRRRLLKMATAASLMWAGRGLAGSRVPERLPEVEGGRKIEGVAPGPFNAKDPLTPYENIVTYNNFIELGPDKRAPMYNADRLKTRPWSVKVDGECEAPGSLDIEDVFKLFPPQERIYRFRCVETWAMVVPWVGFPLGDFLKRFKPTSKAKYVAFETLYDPNMLPGQRKMPYFFWPYTEGLRIDEAMHPLTMLVYGVYGRELPNQCGAPLRLVVPWKYGFKSIKSIVHIRFTEQRPKPSWNRLQPDEYGFYANVNPEVDHPRWSQKYERMLGSGLFTRKRPTRMFNGYEKQVASLYKGMDLRKNY